MDINSPFISNLQSEIAMEPAQGPLQDPAMAAQTLARIEPTPRDPQSDASLPQRLQTPREVVPLVRVQLVRLLSRSATRTSDGLNSIDRRFQHPEAMDIGSQFIAVH